MPQWFYFSCPPQELHLSDYKDLSQTLRIQGAQVIGQESSPLGLLTVVENNRVPFRHAPGMSLNAMMEPPEQLGVFTDGDGLLPITRFDGRRESIAYLDFLTSALPYHLLPQPGVLVLGSGTGADLLHVPYGAGNNAIRMNDFFAGRVLVDFPTYDLIRQGEFEHGDYRVNQMEVAINSVGVSIENLSASESRIRDADIAAISSEMVTRQIMQQAVAAHRQGQLERAEKLKVAGLATQQFLDASSPATRAFFAAYGKGASAGSTTLAQLQTK